MRTRNAGAGAKAVSDASRGAGEQLSKNLLGIRSANAQLKQHQRDTALAGLEGLYGTGVTGSERNLGEIAPLVEANTKAAAGDPWNIFFGSLAKSGGAGIGTALGGG